MTHILGVSAGFHDAAVTVVDRHGEILFAAHSERYSKVKNDANIDPGLVAELKQWDIATISWYERPAMHNLQQLVSGQYQFGPWTVRGAVEKHLGSWTRSCWVDAWPHHVSHAAAGFQTSPFDEAVIVVIDAIGELDTASIFHARYINDEAKYRLLWRQRYPHSIGLFYSAVTKAVELKPMEEEYITMGMAAYGRAHATKTWLRESFLKDPDNVIFSQNLHLGIDRSSMPFNKNEDIAAGAQALTQELVLNIMKRASSLTGCENLVYMGGVALNCVINSRLGKLFKNIWIMPNPGDAGSSLGAAALSYGRKLRWNDAFLGHEITGVYPVQRIMQSLVSGRIVGVASGRAEFGPRALGNRSLLADPRGKHVKDEVNVIKRRQKFRPFAPVILAEHAEDYFEMPRGWNQSPYMQTVAKCRYPYQFPAITHVDGTSRVQTVDTKDSSGIRKLLEAWYSQTGCPMLLNTSLNIRGEPMVNDRSDADRFQRTYGIEVCS